MVVLSVEDFESLLETLAILQDPADRTVFEQARREADEGDVTDEEEMAALIRERLARRPVRWSRKVVFTRTARRQLSEELPELIAVAAWKLIHGDLRDKPQIVSKPLMERYAGDWSARRGTYRIRHRIDVKTLTVLAIKPRSTAYQA